MERICFCDLAKIKTNFNEKQISDLETKIFITKVFLVVKRILLAWGGVQSYEMVPILWLNEHEWRNEYLEHFSHSCDHWK